MQTPKRPCLHHLMYSQQTGCRSPDGSHLPRVASTPYPRLNQYLDSDIEMVGTLNNKHPANAARKFEMGVCRDPSDKASYQFLPPFPTPDNTKSAYDCVGTTYQFQMKWFEQIQQSTGGAWHNIFRQGMQKMQVADNYMPSLMVYAYDQYADITVYSAEGTPAIRNGYGDYNRSCLLFFDGHAKYMDVYQGGQGQIYDPGTGLPRRAYLNDKYSMVFPQRLN